MDLTIKPEQIKDARDYSYGYWMRFLTRYPSLLMDGKNQPWYFVSRLARNDPYGDVALGDRVLALWIGQAGYTFATLDDKTSNPNVY